MRPKWRRLGIAIVLLLLLPYILLSWLVTRPLTLREVPDYLSIAIRSAPRFTDHDSNLRTNLKTRSAARYSPESQAVLELSGGRQHVLPLPPATATLDTQGPNTTNFLTLSNSAQFARYVGETIPSKGWTLRDQTAGRYSFVRDGTLLGVSMRPYAGTAQRLTIAISPAPEGGESVRSKP